MACIETFWGVVEKFIFRTTWPCRIDVYDSWKRRELDWHSTAQRHVPEDWNFNRTAVRTWHSTAQRHVPEDWYFKRTAVRTWHSTARRHVPEDWNFKRTAVRTSNVKIVCPLKHHDKKTCEGFEVYLHAFVVPTLSRIWLSNSLVCCFISRVKTADICLVVGREEGT